MTYVPSGRSITVVSFAYNTEVLGENGTLGRKSYNEIVLVRYLKKALFDNNEWMTDEYANEAMKMHASGYLMKPVTAEDIQAELRDLRYPIFEKKEYLLYYQK